MKKLLSISVIAALAALPMAANAAVGDILSVSDPTAASAVTPTPQADNAVTATTSPKYALAVQGTKDGNLATAGYVKGAYNQAMKAINKVSETASNALTATGTATLTNKTIDADDNTISDLQTGNFKSGVVRGSTAGVRAVASAEDDKLVTEKAIATAIDGMVTETGTQTLTNKTISGATITGGTIDASSTTISNLDTGDFASTALATQTGGGMETDATNASDDKLVTEKAVATALATATTGQVTLNGTQTLTNKTIDADDNTISDLTTSNLKSGTLVDSTTGIATDGTASDSKLVSEAAVADAIADFATQTAVENTIETATITARVPTLTTWGDDSSEGTVGVEVVSIASTYAEPTPVEPEEP